MTNFTDAERALVRAARALNMPPPPRVPTKAERDYRQELAALVLAAMLREITREEFTQRYTARVIDELQRVYTASAGGRPDPILMGNAIQEQTQHIEGLAHDIYTAERYTPREPEEGERRPPAGAAVALLAFLFGRGVVARLNLWVNGRARIANIARTHDEDDPLLVWRLGATEQHCRDCLDANGRVMRASEWRNLRALGIHPQSPSLECGGWNCDCSLQVVADGDD